MNDKYLHNTLEDLLTDDKFVNWVLKQENDQSWQKWMDQNPQIKDKIDEARKMAGNIRFNEVSSSLARKSKLWDKIEESTQGKEVHMPNSSRRIFLYAASVAAIITFVSILLWPDTSTIFRADDLVAEIVTLPSDSKVRVLSVFL